MAAMTDEQCRELQAQLQKAVVECNERCLYYAAKWYVSYHTRIFSST